MLGFDFSKPDALKTDGYKIDAAAMRTHVRSAARDVLAKITTFDAPIAMMIDGKPFERSVPTSEELSIGLSGQAIASIAVLLVQIRNDEVERRKNSRAAAQG